MLAAALVLLAVPGVARADFSGDGPADVLAVHPDGRLLMYRGNGAGGWAPNVPDSIGTGWGSFTAFLAPGDFSGDGKPDVLVRDGDGRLLMYRGNGAGGWAAGARQTVGSGWGGFTALVAPGDFSGDGKPDVLARDAGGALFMYRGDGDGGWLTGTAEKIGSGWGPFTTILGAGDFSGDGKPDVLAVNPAGALLMYRGNGAGGWLTGQAEPVGSGWGGFTALAAGGDFSGDGKPDVLARRSDGALLLYRGNGAGGWLTGHGEPIGSGWNGLNYLTLVPASPPPASGSGARAARAAGGTRARRERDADRGPALHAARRAAPGQREGPPPFRPPRAAGAADRVLRPQGPAPHRSPPALHRAAADAPARRAARARLRAGLLQACRFEDAAPQDRVAALRHVRLGRTSRTAGNEASSGCPPVSERSRRSRRSLRSSDRYGLHAGPPPPSPACCFTLGAGTAAY